jgi:uncharacterized protein YndB with AHSA1/START domain
MRSDGAFIEADTVRFLRVLPEPIERVWAYLTEPEMRSRWLASGRMDLHVGGRVELCFRQSLHPTWPSSPLRPGPPQTLEDGEGASVYGRVTRYHPLALLTYTWCETGGDPSEVTMELVPRHGSVILVLTHGGLRDLTAVASVARRWQMHLGILDDCLYSR